jgi:zinc transporter 2
VILISVVFIAGEIFGGILANSIAIISDAIHLVSDTIGFFFSFLFLYLSKLKANERMTFGYHRMELLGAIFNIIIIWILIFYVVFESTQRIIEKQFVSKPFIMLISAGAGLLINIGMYKVLHGGASHSHGLLSDGCAGHGHGHEHGHQHGH